MQRYDENRAHSKFFLQFLLGSMRHMRPFATKAEKGRGICRKRAVEMTRKGWERWQIRLGFFPYYLYRATVPPSL